MLLPCDLREWVPENDMVHFVIGAVEDMALDGFRVNHRGTGSKQYPPRMMLSLLIYCYANGIFGSRRIEAGTYRDVAVRYLTADTHPDHDTICKFRRENLDAVHECFVKVLELAAEIGVLKVGTVSVDGTKIRANASKHKSLRYDRAGELVEQLDLEVKELLEQAEAADNTEVEEGQRLPEEIARRQALKAKLEQARERLEKRAQERAEADVEAIPGELGAPSAVLADSGYASEDPVDALQANEIEVYVSTGAEAKNQRRWHDFRPRHGSSESSKEPKAEWLKAMKEKLQTDAGRALYARRKQTVEPVFGIVKHVMGFTQFLLRGTEKVSGEWELLTLAYNMKRLWNLKLAVV